MKASTPLVKHLVLIGGGHSHLAVLKRLGMQPVPGLSVTLVTRDVITPYSGSLPAYLSGTCSHEQMHIDLAPLAQFAGARLIHQEVRHIDLESRTISLADRPAISFDILALNTGSAPDANLIAGAGAHAIPIKPIDKLIKRWEQTRGEAISTLQARRSFHIAIIGGGPASIEFALAIQSSLQSATSKDELTRLKISLITADESLLAEHNSKVQTFAHAELIQRGIDPIMGTRVQRIDSGNLYFENSTSLQADTIFYATGASLPDWIGELGLQRSADGFVEVGHTLQSTSHRNVFASGDIATIVDTPRPKSGVYAVRHGKILAHNLIAFARGKRLRRYHPQKQTLALLNLGNGKAIASRGKFFFQGKFVWKLKNRIDSAFLHKYSRLPEMQAEIELSSGLVDKSAELQLRKHALRCAGCGAKVPDAILKEVLSGLHYADDKHSDKRSLASAEDAAIIPLDSSLRLVQSVDLLKAFSLDSWLFARIATNHCLSDMHAMGVTASTAQAIVGLPPASAELCKAQLNEIMQACQQELNAEGCELAGGHSAEADVLQFGLCVNAVVSDNSRLLFKRGIKAGNVLVLTKALGTGTVLAAQMRFRCRYEWLQACLNSMLQSNRAAAEIFVKHAATACTDITGFGLAGHLLEMLEASGLQEPRENSEERVQVELDVSALPILPGALDCLSVGIISSLHADNSLAAQHIQPGKLALNKPEIEILFDPQTAGGLLASIPAESADACMQELHNAGYTAAQIIGRAIASSENIGSGKRGETGQSSESRQPLILRQTATA